MATKKRKFTAKQLRAQRAFARMAKQRAKEAKARNRAMGVTARSRRTPDRSQKRPARRNSKMTIGPVIIRRNGVTKKLHGAAAQAVVRSRKNDSRKATPRRSSGSKRNGVFRQAARKAMYSRLTKPIRFGRRRNGAPAGIEEMHRKFLGRGSDKSFNIVAPAGTPKDVAVLGELTKLKTESEEFIFDKGEAYMGADAKGNLYVLGDITVEQSTNFGELEEICYLARKDHLNPFHFRKRKARRNPGQLTEYYHEFGEEGGTLPHLKSDRDGMLHITGGSYTIEPEGITD